ncbi:hypothetical protein CR513_45007, partial [Mucuna pruriens]
MVTTARGFFAMHGPASPWSSPLVAIILYETSDEYENGVKSFLDFAKTYTFDSIGRFYCLYVNCLNERRLEVEEIWEHLICDGFYKTYTTWTWHGKLLDIPSAS